MVESHKIVGLGVIAAIAYGIAHDSVTARVCVEYFTIGHPPVFGTDSPTLLALGWGVLATWWVGLGLGIFLAIVCRFGSKPKLGAGDLLGPLGSLLATMGVVSLVAGLVGYHAASRRWIGMNGSLAEVIPLEKQAAFLADLSAHLAAYGSACAGGMALAVWSTIRRHSMAKLRPTPVPDPDPT